MTATSRSTDLGWLLDDLVARVHGADRVVVLSSDGLLMARSRSTAQADAEHLSAMASAYQSLSRGVGRHFAGGMVRQTVVELERAFLLVIAAGEGSVLALLATEDAELGQIAYEMHLLVRRVAASLVAAPRAAGAGTP